MLSSVSASNSRNMISLILKWIVTNTWASACLHPCHVTWCVGLLFVSSIKHHLTHFIRCGFSHLDQICYSWQRWNKQNQKRICPSRFQVTGKDRHKSKKIYRPTQRFNTSYNATCFVSHELSSGQTVVLLRAVTVWASEIASVYGDRIIPPPLRTHTHTTHTTHTHTFSACWFWELGSEQSKIVPICI